MSKEVPRRTILRALGVSAAARLIKQPLIAAADEEVRISGKLARVSIRPASRHTTRITIAEKLNLAQETSLYDGAVVATAVASAKSDQAGAHDALRVSVSQNPLTFHIEDASHRAIQVLKIGEQDGSVTFQLGDPIFGMGEGGPARLTRIRMFYDGPQLDRANERPFALHRNGYPGMQRYAPFLWSGDVYSTWETLRTHIPIGINTGLSGIPLWGTDTGGFVPTKEFTGELFVRWFQFSAFCPLFRGHGRDWKLRLPWGWNTGELGPNRRILIRP
jgi:hypothetical protein